MSSPSDIGNMHADQTPPPPPYLGNVSLHLQTWARALPRNVAIAAPLRREWNAQLRYQTKTFAELEADVAALAAAVKANGVLPGTRIALLVKPGIEFITVVFGLLRAGVVLILIDPGMGRAHLLRCLQEAQPKGFVAIPLAQAVLRAFRSRFPLARFLVTVGPRWFWGGTTYSTLLQQGHRLLSSAAAEANASTPVADLDTAADSPPAAIIFTTGSTGPPKGVLYTHRIFEQQVFEIQRHYQIRPGDVDLPAFPLFGLFNAAMGVTTVVPQMNASRPAQLDPRRFLEALGTWKVNQSFGSPAVWKRVLEHCQCFNIHLPQLKRILSAGAAVSPALLAGLRAHLSESAEIHTPYGATECLPVASIESREVLHETAVATRSGAGVCVGRKFPGIRWKVIATVDGPLTTIAETTELPSGEIGELIVQGDVVTREYVTRTEWNPLSKIQDGTSFWHRIGDVGYLDNAGRFWYCGRKGHRVLTMHGTLYTEQCEAILCEHPDVNKAALVGVGQPGRQTPVIVVEFKPESKPSVLRNWGKLRAELRELAAANPLTQSIEHFVQHPRLPVDIRHNAKIFREQLVPWAAQALDKGKA